ALAFLRNSGSPEDREEKRRHPPGDDAARSTVTVGVIGQGGIAQPPTPAIARADMNPPTLLSFDEMNTTDTTEKWRESSASQSACCRPRATGIKPPRPPSARRRAWQPRLRCSSMPYPRLHRQPLGHRMGLPQRLQQGGQVQVRNQATEKRAVLPENRR